MKITSVLALAALLAASWTPSWAVPLSATAAVQTRPDPAAPVITYLKAGSEPVPASQSDADLPPGWIAVQLPGPFDGYVQNQDLTKGLDVKPGASIYLEPKLDAGVLATAEKGDKTEITGLEGKWTQVRLEKSLVGYVQVGPAAIPAAVPAPPPAPPIAAAPAEGRAVAVAGYSADMPRFFAGRFVSTRRPLAPRRPFDWQLEDPSGTRIAYLDISRLLLTDQIEAYRDHFVVVYGTLKAAPGGKDIVIAVESLRLQ